MAKKKYTGKTRKPATTVNKPARSVYDYRGFKSRATGKLIGSFIVLSLLFFISLFKNISYPLFWADESMTAIGTERVLRFGYPKVHDGKNVFYDLRHSNPRLGINESDDAYVGGTGWGHYYFGVIGYKLAESTRNLYLKTALYRITFACAGLFGLFLLGFFISKFFFDRFSKYAFLTFFVLLELLSVSLVLLLREVRYYSPTLLLLSLIIASYCAYRFHKPFNKVLFVTIQSISLWLLFNTFAPAYFIVIVSIGLSELIVAVRSYLKTSLRAAIYGGLPTIIPLVISLIGVFPLFHYFKTFEISRAMSEFNGFTREMYWANVSTVFNYFKNFELLWLAITLRILLWLNGKKFLKSENRLFQVSNFLTLFFVVYLLSIATIPNFIYTRYIIYLQPFLSIIIVLDFFMLLKLHSASSQKFLPLKMIFPILVFIALFTYTFLTNLSNITGHLYELSHQYKGPLDYTIPHIKEKYPRTDALTIAANYEETSYMYYLKSKVIIGFIGNNLAEDSVIQPQIIAYRKPWGNYTSIFNRYLQNETFRSSTFPVKDNPTNNIPELNFVPAFNHQFRTPEPENPGDSTQLFYK